MLKMMESKKKHSEKPIIMLSLIIILFIVCILSLSTGRYKIPVRDVLKAIFVDGQVNAQAINVLFKIRAPRILGAVLVGAALALSGSIYQGLFHNPLVSQDLLGVSAGSTVGASVAILLGFHHFGIMVSSLITGIVAVIITVALSKLIKTNGTLTLVLAGIIVGGMFNSLQGVLKYIADPESQLAAITFWTLGSLADLRTSELNLIVIPMVVSIIFVSLLRWRVNVLSYHQAEESRIFSDSIAKYLLILFATLLTSCAVSISGTINWIGLVTPHIARLLIGSDHRKMLPVCALIGSIFLVVIDTLARSLNATEIPLGILTGLLGAPLYMWILFSRKGAV